MKGLDRILQAWRCREARPWVPRGARVLDVGCHQGEFLDSMAGRIGPSVGLDPLAIPAERGAIRLLAEPLREGSPFPDGSFDAIVMLATLEHVRDKATLARECARLAAPGGRLIISVPSRAVDPIVDWLVRLKVADGMSLEEHHGYDPMETPALFGRHGFEPERHRRFQLGCNHLFIFRRAAGPPTSQAGIPERATSP